MAINGGKIEFGIGYKVDQSGLKTVQTQLQNLKNYTPQDLLNFNPNIKGLDKADEKLKQIQKVLIAVETAYDDAFDSKTGITNIDKLSQELKKTGYSTKEIQAAFNALGPAGAQAFNSMTNQLSQLNLKFKETNGFLDKMGETLVNTVKWSIASSAVNKFTGAIQQAWGYVQHLDTSLNDIRIVTGKSADEMNKFAGQANDAAKALGSSTTEYTEAALIYYQQGLGDEESQARAETTLKAANVTGQTGQQVSEELTAVWNGYKVTAEETELYVDKLAAVAASTASDLEELSTGMSKVASAANNMGVDVDQLNAQLATIVSVTRQAPETAGTALKTIFARIEDLKLGGTDEDGVKLGQVSSGLESMGIEIKDAQGNLRDLGEVIEEIGGKWDTWTESQKSAIAQLVAGKRQYNNLLALFDNWDMYNDALETSQNAAGTLQQQQDIYMDSTEAHLQQLSTEWEDLYDSVIDTESVNTVADGLTDVLDIITNIIDSIGGGKGLLLGIVAVLTSVGPIAKAISNEIGGILTKSQNAKENAQKWAEYQESIKNFTESDTSGASQAKEYLDKINEAGNLVSNQQKQEAANHIARLKQLGEEKDQLQQQYELATKIAEEMAQAEKNRYGEDVVNNVIDDKGNISKAAVSATGLEQTSNMFESQNIISEEAKNQFDEYLTKLKEVQAEKEKFFNDLKTLGIDPDSEEGIEFIDQETKKLQAQIKELQELRESFSESESGSLNENLNYLDGASRGMTTQMHQNMQEIEQDLLDMANDASQTGQAINHLGAEGQTAFNNIQQSQATVSEGLNNLPQQIQQAGESFAQESAEMQDHMNSIDMSVVGQGVTDLIGGITSLGFSMTSVANIGSIIGDKNMSDMDRFTQLISAGIMGLPGLFKGLSKLKDGFTTVGGAIVQSVKNGQGLFAGLKTAISSLNPVLIGVTAGFGLLFAGISYHQKQLENLAETSRETAEAQQEIIDKSQEEYDKVEELNQSYTELLNQRDKDNKFSIEQEHQVYELVKAYGDQSLIIQALAGDYDALKESIQSAQNEANQQLITDLEEGKKDYNFALTNAIKSKGGMTEIDSEGYDLGGVTDDFEKDLQELLGTRDDIIDSSGHIAYDNLNKLLTLETTELQEFLKKYDDLEASDQIRQVLSDNKDLIDSLKENSKQLDTATTNAIGYGDTENINKISSLQDYEDEVDKLAEQAFTEGAVKSKEEGEEWARQFLQGYSNELSQYDSKDALVNTLYENIPSDMNRIEAEKQINKAVDNLSESEQGYLAANKGLFEAYLKEGKSVEEVIQTLSKGMDSFTEKDHNVKIKAVIDKNFAQKELDELFADESFSEKIGMSQSEFEGLDKGEQYNILNQQAFDNAVALNNMSEEEVEFEKEKKKILEDQIAAQQELINKKKEEKDLEIQQNANEEFLGGFTNAQGQEAGNFDTVYDNLADTDLLGDKTKEELKEEYTSFVNDLSDIYQQALAQGLDPNEEIEKFIQNSEKLKDNEALSNFMAEMMENRGLEYTTEGWKGLAESYLKVEENATKAAEADEDFYKDLQKEEDKLSELNAEKDKTIDIDQDFNELVNEQRKGIAEYNKTIDSLQSSYQTLSDITKDYNEDQALSLDNVQKLLEMDDAYVASLEFQNGQLVINDNTMRSMIDSKIEQMKINATQLYYEELLAIANQENTDASKENEKQNLLTAKSIDAITGACDGGIDALLKLSEAEAAAEVDSEKTKEATEAYYNRMKMIEQLSNQSTNTLLGKSSSSSSKSSSSSSSTEEYLEREEDIYKGINEQLDNIESTLSRIQKIDEHSWGVSAKKALEQENELLEKQSELLEKKAATYESDLSTRRKALEDQGVTFTDDGSAMTNSETVLNNLYTEYNAMVDKYNAMSKDDQETYKVTLEAKKETIENIENAMDDYESAYNDYNSVLDEILDNHYELIENAVNQFNADIDVRLELDEARENWEDFWAEVMEDLEDDDFVGKFNQNFRKLDIYTGVTSGADTSKIADLTQHVGDTTSEVNKQIASAATGGDASIFGDDSALSKETLTNYRDQLMEAVRSAKSAIDDMMDNYLSELSSAKEKIDEQVDGWNRIGDVINHDVEMTKLLYGDKAYEDLNYHFEQQYDNNLKLVETQKMSMDYWGKKVKEEEALMNSYEEGSEQYKMHEKAYKEASQNYKDAIADLNKTVEDSIKSLQEWRENQVASITDTLDKALSGGMGLENMEKQWDLVLEMQDTYLDNVERAVEMESLQFDFNDVLNNMDLREDKQKEFLKFMDEENEKLKEKNKLTQYDIDEVKARLEIKKAEMALEEAQRNKSNMRLRRDTQGNYTYQYTANEDDVEDAEKSVLTARREWYELVKKRNMDLSKEVIDIRKRIVEEEKVLAEAQANHDVEAERAAQERIALLKQQGVALMAEAEKAKQNDFSKTATIFQDVENGTVLPAWNTAVQGMIDKWSNGGEESFVGAVTTATTNLENVQTEFGNKTKKILEDAGLNYDSFRTGHVDPTKAALDDLQGSNEELGTSLDDVDKNLITMNSDLDKAIEGYNGLKDAAVKAIEAANKSLETLAKTAIESVEKIKTAVQAAQTAPSLVGNGSNKTQQQANNSTYDPTYSPEKTGKVYDRGEATKGPDGKRSWYLVDTSENAGNAKLGLDFRTDDKQKAIDYFKQLYPDYTIMKSGGYTGDWNQGIPGTDNGRLAVLHQKELVLNEADTANLLKAVSLIRTLVGVANSADFNRIASSVVGAGSTSAQLANSVSSGAFQSIASNVTNNSNVSNSKDITINADFSGVRSADEIYQALTELQNYGMQESYSTAPHANRSY